MSIRMRVVVLIASFASTMNATIPRPLPTPAPPQDIPSASPRHEMPHPPFGLGSRATREAIDSLGLSTTVRNDLLAHLPSQVSTGDTKNTSATAGSKSATASRGFSFAPETTHSGYGTGMTADSYGDIEPSVVVNRYVENNVTVDRAIVASTKFYNGNPWHYWSAIGGGQFLGGWLNAPPGCDHTSDPMIAENPFTTPGTLPLRTYIVGTSYSVADGHTTYNEMSLWYKDNFQDLPNPVWSRQTVEWTNYPYFFDKPSLAVSWYPQRLGWVYVACVMVNTPSSGNPTHTIYLFRGTPFGTMLDFGYGALNRSVAGLAYEIVSPIVMVDDQNGDVYVAWVDQLHSQIKMARSTDQGETFSSTFSFSTGLLLPPISSAYIQDDGGHTVAAPSMLMGKLHSGHIGLVWHQYETSIRPVGGGASYYTTDAYFRSFDTASQTWLQAAPVHVGTTSQNDHVDQWSPALDVMSNGDFLVSWYDKRDDAFANRNYFLYAKRITAAGNPMDADVKLDLVCQWTGNPADHCGGSQSYRSTAADTEQLFVAPGDVGRTHHLIGDYQDFWVWYSDYGYGGTIFTRPNMNGDPFLSQVFP